MRIDGLLATANRGQLCPAPESDALAEDDALVEAALLEVRLDQVRSDAWLLLDCRGALQIENANTAVVIVRGVTECSWRSVGRGARTWRSVMSWRPDVSDRWFRIVAAVEPDGDLSVTGISAEFYLGNTRGGDEPPPDFAAASESEMSGGLASWASEIEVVGASFVL